MRNIEIFRFDEAAKHAYQFVWHLYCDWYLEFLKPIFNSKNKLEVKEAKIFSTFMMANILRMLHPFIPFFTEFVWSSNSYKKVFKNDLISSNWPTYKSLRKFNQNQIKLTWLFLLLFSSLESYFHRSWTELPLNNHFHKDMPNNCLLVCSRRI